MLHPNLADALSDGFHLLVGRAPFAVRLWTENARGYRLEWDLDGDGQANVEGAWSRTARFERPGVYAPSIRLLAWGRQPKILRQRIVVLGDEPAVSAPGKYGVNQDLAWDWLPHVPQEVALMREVGLQWLRMPIRWYWVEPEQGAYTWVEVDPVVDQALDAGLEILAVLGSTPAWSSGVGKGDVPKGVYWDAFEPSRTSDFGAYAYAVAGHYDGRIQAYEVLNEPNSLNHWRPQPNARRFVELLCAGYYAIKYVNPGNVVVVGGLNGNGLTLGWEPPEGRDFLKAIYASPARECFDVMAIHPFTHPTEDGLPGLQAWVDEAHDYMRSMGDERELWLTEIGWSTAPNVWGHTTITEQQQAAWVEAVYRDLVGPEKVFWYNFKETGTHPAEPEQHWGWLRYDLEPKPAFEAFRRLEK